MFNYKKIGNDKNLVPVGSMPGDAAAGPGQADRSPTDRQIDRQIDRGIEGQTDTYIGWKR